MSARARGHLRLVGPGDIAPRPDAPVDVAEIEAAYQRGAADTLSHLGQGLSLNVTAFELGRQVERLRWEGGAAS